MLGTGEHISHGATSAGRGRSGWSGRISPVSKRVAVPPPAGGAPRGGVHLRRRRADHLLQPARGPVLGSGTETQRPLGPLLRLVPALQARRIVGPSRPVLDGPVP